MTYYEELGVDGAASAEEIRRAYRKLVQLLHPDQHRDQALQRICERQLARLNGIAETLEDPERRREYDLELRQRDLGVAQDRDPVGPSSERIRPSRVAWCVWTIAAAAGIALMALLFRWNAASAGDAPYPPEASRPQAGAAQAGPPAARTPATARTAGPKHPRALPTPVPALPRAPGARALAAPLPDPPASQPLPSHAAPVAPPAAPITAAAYADEAARRQSYFAGTWFFWPDAAKPDAMHYPPERIEVAITEENGVLHGRYRSRYRVADLPISPDVNFHFSGPAGSGDQVELQWDGAEGAAGQIRLKAITPVSMEASWWATRMGGLDLTSGTAVLIRAKER